jgi:NADPH:quinone reductase-like Zn-dependent oxidoreductase
VKNADLSHYWFGPNRAQLKTFAQDTKWIAEGKLKPYISQVIKLEEAQNALEQLNQGKGGFEKF